MVEAQAAGTPVIAYGRGGAADIVQPGQTGLLFPEQTAAAITRAVAEFVAGPAPSPETCRANAERFSEEAFRAALIALVRG